MENHIEIAEETKQDKGFTLVELLIVIVILGILATVTVFAVTGITTRGKDSACKSDMKVIQVAEEANNANTGSYANLATLKTNGLIHDIPSNFKVTLAGSGATATYTVQGLAAGVNNGETAVNATGDCVLVSG